MNRGHNRGVPRTRIIKNHDLLIHDKRVYLAGRQHTAISEGLEWQADLLECEHAVRVFSNCTELGVPNNEIVKRHWGELKLDPM